MNNPSSTICLIFFCLNIPLAAVMAYLTYDNMMDTQKFWILGGVTAFLSLVSFMGLFGYFKLRNT